MLFVAVNRADFTLLFSHLGAVPIIRCARGNAAEMVAVVRMFALFKLFLFSYRCS